MPQPLQVAGSAPGSARVLAPCVMAGFASGRIAAALRPACAREPAAELAPGSAAGCQLRCRCHSAWRERPQTLAVASRLHRRPWRCYAHAQEGREEVFQQAKQILGSGENWARHHFRESGCALACLRYTSAWWIKAASAVFLGFA